MLCTASISGPMRAAIAIVSILSIWLSAASSQASTTPIVGIFQFEQIYSCGDGLIWGLGDSSDGCRLYLSKDCGETWSVKSPPSLLDPHEMTVGANGASFDNDLTFVNSKDGFIITHTTGPGAKMYVHSTTDGGRTWKLFNFALPLNSINIQSVSFPDSGHGAILMVGQMALGMEDKLLFTTSDGGVTWYKTTDTSQPNDPSALPIVGYPTGLTFRDKDHGWISELYRNDAVKTPLYRTVNAGLMWVEDDLDLATKLPNSYTNTFAPHFFTESGLVGVLIADYISHNPESTALQAFLTNDGGETWTPTSNITTPLDTTDLTWCSYDQKRLWVIDEGGTVEATSDGGHTWSKYPQSVPFRSDFSSLQMVAVGAYDLAALRTGSTSINGEHVFDSTLFVSRDGGVTWKMPTGPLGWSEINLNGAGNSVDN